MSYRVYIGHSAKDSELAKDLARRLAEAGVEAIFPPAQAETSRGMGAMIHQRVRESDEVIVLLTDNVADNYWVSYGMGVADSMDKRQMPVVVNLGVEQLLPMVGKNFIKYADLPKYISSLKKRAKAAEAA
jgi:hypothetical protein